MICVFAENTSDCSTNGTGMLQPDSCVVRQTAGGFWGLTLTHPLTQDGAWQTLQVGALLRVPVPLRETPRMETINPGTPAVERQIRRVKNKVCGLFSEPTFDAPMLKKLQPGTAYEWLQDITPDWHRALSSDGTAGYLYTPDTEWAYTEVVSPGEAEMRVIVPARQVREQLFRITETAFGPKGMTIHARHLSYDLMGDMLGPCDLSGGVSFQQALARLQAACLGGLGSRSLMLTEIDGVFAQDISWINPVRALLDPEGGIVHQARARLVRDNLDFFLLKEAATDRGTVLRYGVQLQSLRWSRSDEGTVNRVIPYGWGPSGRITLPSVWVDAPERSGPLHTAMLPVNGVTAPWQQEQLLHAADAFFARGNAQVPLRLQVSLAPGTAEQIFLYDMVTVEHPPTGLVTRAQVTGYEWDALRQRYTSLRLGDAWSEKQDRIAGYSLPGGSVGLEKLDLQALRAFVEGMGQSG